jgi:membrane protease YdiL (CAAX protease family)
MRELIRRPAGSALPLPRPLLEARRPFLAIGVGWLTAFLPGLALAALVTTLLPPSAQPQFAVPNVLAVLLFVIFAPVVETLIMAVVLGLLLRVLPAAAAVVVSAIGWGIAHSLAAPAWGLVVWWPFLVFSTLYVTWRRRSLLAAIAIPAATHALHNLLPALLLLSEG